LCVEIRVRYQPCGNRAIHISWNIIILSVHPVPLYENAILWLMGCEEMLSGRDPMRTPL
jgi:hypothetical protein